MVGGGYLFSPPPSHPFNMKIKKIVLKFGNSAHVILPKEYIGKKVYVSDVEDEFPL